MRRVRPGPERDAAIQRMRERWAADEAVLTRAPFPILGLAPPFPSPLGLGSFETVNGHIVSIGLRYGGSGPPPDAVVTVTTAPASEDRDALPIGDVLDDLLRETSDVEHVGPAGHGEPEATEVFVDGVPWMASTIDNGQAW